MLKGFSGYLQTDGYSTYNVVESVTRVGCWAHARRKWVDCFEGKKPVEESQSEKAFAYVEKIFALEACWRDMSPDERQKHRMAEMKPVMDAYWDFLSSFSSEKMRKVIDGYDGWSPVKPILKDWFGNDYELLMKAANDWRNELAHEKRSYEPDLNTVKAVRLVEHLNYCIVLRKAGYNDDEISAILECTLAR